MALSTKLFGGIGSIVVLHRVVASVSDISPLPSFGGEIDVEYLREILAFCRRSDIDIVSLDEAVARIVKARASEKTKRFIVFTFDDGWRDNLTLALPLFREFSEPLTVYIATGFPDGRPLAWKYSVSDLLFGQQRLQFSFASRRYDFDLRTIAGKDAAYRAIVGLYTETAPAVRDEMLCAVLGGSLARAEEKTKELALSWADIQTLAADPLVTIGAHTVNHHNLALLDAAHLEQELRESKVSLERKLGRPVRHLAYPYGRKPQASVREFAAAQSAGFATATTMRAGNIFSGHNDLLHCLPRINASGKLNRLEFFEASLSGLVPAIANRLKRVVGD